MKLFIWNEPYRVSYGSTCLFAVAETVEEAREVIKTNGKTTQFGIGLDDYCLSDDTVLGEPTFILDAPCAVNYFWDE